MSEKKYDVLIIQPVLVKIKGIKATSQTDAIKVAEDNEQFFEDLRALLDNHAGHGMIAYTEIEENGWLYAVVDEYEGEQFSDDPGDEEHTLAYGPDGKTILNGDFTSGIDDPLGEWRRNHDKSDPWSIDRVQFARVLAELACEGLSEEQYKFLSESADMDPDMVDEIMERARDAFERDKEEFCK